MTNIDVLEHVKKNKKKKETLIKRDERLWKAARVEVMVHKMELLKS